MTNTVLIKRSSVANSVPLAGNLQPGELAINYNDGNLFYKNTSNVVTVIASNKFVSVSGNVTGGNIITGGVVSTSGIVGTGNINFASSGNISLGNVGNIHISGGSSGYVLSTNGSGNLSWVAQSGGSGSSTITVDDFTGDGSTTQFTLSVTPTNINSTTVNYNGVIQLRTGYSLSGANIVFSTPPASGSSIEVTSISVALSGSVGGSNTQVQFNDGGTFGANSAFTFNKTTGNLGVPNLNMSGNIMPTSNNVYSIGASDMVFKHVYIGPGSLYIDGSKVLASSANTIIVSADLNQNVRVTTTGTGDVELLPAGTGSVAVKGPLQIQAGKSILSSDGNAVNFASPLAVDSITSHTANTDITLSAQGTGHVRIDDDLIVSGNLTVDGSGGNLSVVNLSVQDNIIDISAETTGIPTQNAGLRVVRGDYPATQIRWYESGAAWQFTNDGTAYQNIVGTNGSGSFSVSGNITGAYFIGNGSQLTGLPASYANADVAAYLASGSDSSNIITTANVSGGNILTTGLVSATGNITGNYILGNGSQLTGLPAGYSNAQVASYLASGSDSSNIITTANITGSNILTGGLISATSTITSAANITGGNLLTGGLVSATGNITGGNVTTNVLNAASGNLLVGTSAGNINIVPTTGNIVLSSGNTYINNVKYPVQNGDAASKDYVDTMISSGIAYHQAVSVATTANLATTTGGTITYTQPNGAGNGIGAKLTTTGSFNLIDAANVQTVGTRILVKNEGNAVYNGVYTWANATNIVRSTDTDEYGPNSVEQLSINDYFFVQSGNVNAGSAYVVDAPSGTITFGTSNITFAQFSTSQVYSANGSAGLSLVGTVFSAKVDNATTAFDGNGNIIVKASATLTTPNIGAATGTSLSATANITGGNILTGGLISATGNITGGNLSGTSIAGTLTTAAQNNITSVGTLSSLTVTANVTGGNILTSGQISASGNIATGASLVIGAGTGGNLTGGNVISANTFTATANITGGNILTGGLISATGNITGAYFIGNGSQLTGISTSTSKIFNGTSEANIGTANGNANISIAGTSNVVVVANTGMYVTGIVSASGNIATGASLVIGAGTGGNLTGANVISGTTLSATANITGGNVLTGGLISATGNITGGNILGGANVNATTHTGTTVSVSANITGGNFLTTGLISAASTITSAANITGGNLLTTGLISAASSITGTSFITNGTVSATSNITGGNILTTGIVSATGNILTTTSISAAGSILTASSISAIGNITGGNILGGANVNATTHTGTTVSVTANITGGNILTSGIVSAVGNITSAANVSGTYFIGNGSQLTGITSTVTPAGSNTQIQFNDTGSLGASANLTFNKSTNTLNATNVTANGAPLATTGKAIAMAIVFGF